MKNSVLVNGVNNNGAVLNNKGEKTMKANESNRKSKINVKGDVKMNKNNSVKGNKNIAVEGDMDMTNEFGKRLLSLKATTFMKIEFLRSAGRHEEAAAELVKLSKMPTLANYSKAKTLKQAFKKMEVYLMQGLEVFAPGYHIDALPKVQAQQETELLRTVGVEPITMAEEAMALVGKGTRKLLSVKIHKTLLKVNKRDCLIAFFDLLINGFYVIYNEATGKAVFSEEMPEIKDDKHVAYRYQFLGITPSGLRTASIMTAATAKITKDGIVENDNRIEILDKALHGAFVKEFISYDANGNIVFMEDTLDKIFKSFTRVLQSAPASKKLFTAKNYIIVDNIAKHAQYNSEDYNNPTIFGGVSCEDTQDGASLICLESLRTHFKRAEKREFSFSDLASIVLQLRGASAKKSGLAKSRKHMGTLLNAILDIRGAQAKAAGLYTELSDKEAGLQALINSKKPMVVVSNGVRYEGKDITIELVKETLSKIEILGDWNAYKLANFNPKYDVLALKQGYTSKTSLNTVVNLMLQSVKSDKAYELIAKKVKLAINKTLESIGIVVETDENGNAVDLRIDSRKLGAVNNDSQFAQFLMKNNPEKLTRIAPQIMKSLIGNSTISIKNLITYLNPEVDSHYTVVQSDPAVLFGCRLLKDDEIYCNDFFAPRVSAVRHPISSMSAVSTFKMVSFEEIVNRIDKLKVSVHAKDYMREHFQFAKGFCTIPASHDKMQKHDGMDFDIDAMQIIVDQEIVEVLAQIPDLSTVIDRSFDVKSNISTNKSKAEITLELFRQGKIAKLGEFREESAAVSLGKNPLAKSFKKTISNDKKLYNMSQESVGLIVRNYFMNPIATVGMIATGFYNNAMILNALKSNISQEEKEKIALAFQYEYGCSGVKSYESPFKIEKSEEGHDIMVLHKENCTRVMYNYANSTGTVEDVIKFLEDCAGANRYPGETSIDSAKNMYQIIDMFNHGEFIKALGSDKNSSIELVSNDDLFASIVNQLNEDFKSDFSGVNTFNMQLLSFEHDCILLNDISKEDIPGIIYENKEARREGDFGKCIGVKDEFAILKEELVDYTNFLLTLAIKTVETVANSQEAIDERAALILEKAKLSTNKGVGSTDKLFNSILAISIAVNDTIGSSTEFDEQNSNLYKKNQAVKILKNTATLMFDGLSKEEIGLAAMAYIAEKYEDKVKKSEKISTINRTILTVFEEEILAYLDSINWNTLAGERIISITEGSKVIKPATLEGADVVFEDGVGTIENTNYIVTSENKHSDVTGTIKVIDGHAYVTFERAVTERDASLGIYIGVSSKTETEFLKNKYNLDIFDEVKFQKKGERMVNGKPVKSLSSLLGVKNDKTYVACDLFVNKNVADVLDSLENGTFEIFYKESENKNITDVNVKETRFVFFNAPELANVINDIIDANNSDIVDFADIAPVDQLAAASVDDIFASLEKDLVNNNVIANKSNSSLEAGIAGVPGVGDLSNNDSDDIFGGLQELNQNAETNKNKNNVKNNNKNDIAEIAIGSSVDSDDMFSGLSDLMAK